MKRLTKHLAIFLLLCLLLGALTTITVFADDRVEDGTLDEGGFDNEEDEPLTEEELAALERGYSVSLNEEDRHLLVIVHPTKLEEKPMDFTYAFVTAAAANSSVEISGRKITVVFDSTAVKEISAAEGPITLYLLGPERYTAPTEDTEAEKSEPNPYAPLPEGICDGDDYCVMRLEGATVRKGSIKVTVTYRPQNADNVRVISVDADGNADEMKVKCKDKRIKYTTSTLTSLIITEREAVSGAGMVKLLTLALGAALLGSAVLAVLIVRKGRMAKNIASDEVGA